MKKIIHFISLLMIIISCSSTKNLVNDKLFNTTWELSYISGPRIAFEGLFPNKKPQIKFDKATGKAGGTDGCNGYLADYTINGATIAFGDPGPTTMMYCGEGEKVFLTTMKKVNRFTIDSDDQLILMIDEIPMLRFKKTQ